MSPKKTKQLVALNSAIALAMEGLGYGNKELNFASGKHLDKGDVDPKQLFKNLTSNHFQDYIVFYMI